MKKLLFLITSVLAIGTACVSAGCSSQGGPDATTERSYNIEQQNGDIAIPDDDNDRDGNDCNDGNCEDKELPESLPEFNFRPHRPYHAHGERNQERETADEDDGEGEHDENEDRNHDHAKPVRPHKTRPNKKNPTPKPMPLKPRR